MRVTTWMKMAIKWSYGKTSSLKTYHRLTLHLAVRICRSTEDSFVVRTVGDIEGKQLNLSSRGSAMAYVINASLCVFF